MSIEVWGNAFLQSIGNFFMNPFLYYMLGCVVVIAMVRMKKERKQFFVKIYDQSLEFQMVFKQGIIIGLVLSVLTLLLGITMPATFMWAVGIAFLCISLTGRMLLFSPVYVLAVSLVVGLGLYYAKGFLPEFLKINSIGTIFEGNLMPLFTLLLFAEGFLVGRFGGQKTSPGFTKSSRGGRIGTHISRKLWIVPLFLLIPAGDISSTVEWWPVFGTGAEAYTILLMPVPLGYGMVARGFFPEDLGVLYARRVYQAAWIGVLASILSYFIPDYSWVLFLFVGLYYMVVTIQLRRRNGQKVGVFSRHNGGITVLEVLQGTPADLMGIEKGELIVKANGERVETMVGLYDVLSRNRAYVKLEVQDRLHEIRHVHRSFHDGDHHELGIIAVKEENLPEGSSMKVEFEDTTAS